VRYFETLQKELSQYLEPEQLAEVEKAYEMAYEAHAGQKRQSGEDYITHPVSAALVLAGMRVDYQTIIAALLHDVLEDTHVTKTQIKESFGESVADLVDGVSKLQQIKFESRAEAQAENFRKMILAMVQDIRVILVKLADRLHNMRTLGVMPIEKKRRIAKDTIEIYAPIANRLGIHHFYLELEELGFQALYPMRYRILRQSLKKAQGNRKEIISAIEQEIREALNTRNIPVKAVRARQKHLYSTYKKMRTKKASFSEIMDVYGFRIILTDVDTCYRALGIVHSLYKPRAERFKDYIAIPKVNGYQSLHTTLSGPYGVPIEVQIRTEEMDQVAENGIAAHWLYKSSQIAVDKAQGRAREWIKELLDMQKSTGSSLEFIESVKIDLFPDDVYVFTPEGDILELPKGATPVDFAYAIHSDIGDMCIAAKIDRRLAPLSQPLKNGQTIEIITTPNASPNPAWLNFVATGKARSKIRYYLKNRQREEAIQFGKRLFQKACEDNQVALSTLSSEQMQTFLHNQQYKTMEDLYEEIALGIKLAEVMVERLISTLGTGQKTLLAQEQNEKKPILIEGTEGLLLKFGECCMPIPGDSIVGYLNVGKGVEVHRQNCRKLAKLRQHFQRLIPMRWHSGIQGEFSVSILIEVKNQRGVLAELANVIALSEANIENISLDQRDGNYNDVHFTLSVRNRVHLARVMKKLRQLNSVIRIYRKRNF